MVRADGRSAAGEEVVAERVPGELRSRPGLHRRLGLAGDVRRSALADRAEIFGAWTLVRRIDRDVRPLFVPTQPVAGGLVNEYPFVRQGWTDNQLGDLWLGAKFNLTVAVAAAAGGVRGARACQAADRRRTTTQGVGTGKTDFALRRASSARK